MAEQRVRVGLGYDRHRMAPVAAQSGERGREMVMGGVVFQYARGPVAHSRRHLRHRNAG